MSWRALFTRIGAEHGGTGVLEVHYTTCTVRTKRRDFLVGKLKKDLSRARTGAGAVCFARQVESYVAILQKILLPPYVERRRERRACALMVEIEISITNQATNKPCAQLL